MVLRPGARKTFWLSGRTLQYMLIKFLKRYNTYFFVNSYYTETTKFTIALRHNFLLQFKFLVKKSSRLFLSEYFIRN